MKKLFALAAASMVLLFGTGQAIAEDIVDKTATDSSFKVFSAALKTAGFTEALKGPGPYTVFAPTDEAFSKLPPGTWDVLSKDKVKLAEILAYHVIPGKVMVSEIKPGEVETTQGATLKLTSDNGKVTVNDANLIQSDIVADNGVIHGIDKVVLPPN